MRWNVQCIQSGEIAENMMRNNVGKPSWSAFDLTLTYMEEVAVKAYKDLEKRDTKVSYKVLAETTLILTILHNRKRVGDVQYLLKDSYKDQQLCPKQKKFLSLTMYTW